MTESFVNRETFTRRGCRLPQPARAAPESAPDPVAQAPAESKRPHTRPRVPGTRGNRTVPDRVLLERLAGLEVQARPRVFSPPGPGGWDARYFGASGQGAKG